MERVRHAETVDEKKQQCVIFGTWYYISPSMILFILYSFVKLELIIKDSIAIDSIRTVNSMNVFSTLIFFFLTPNIGQLNWVLAVYFLDLGFPSMHTN